VPVNLRRVDTAALKRESEALCETLFDSDLFDAEDADDDGEMEEEHILEMKVLKRKLLAERG
jgi:hypothetical protein